MGDNDIYFIETILDRRRVNDRLEYKIKWEGYPMSQSTWEPLSNLQTAKELVDEYDRLHPIQNKKLTGNKRLRQGAIKIKKNNNKSNKVEEEEVDENLDGYVSEREFENMYKKCITDEKEEEGKKLFYLAQFLMYDKDEKHEITVEDTLEILCARHQNNVDQALDAIFDIEKIDENGKKKRIKRETISFLEYAQRMHELSMKKRNEISNLKKTFCDNLKQEALKEAKERADRKNFEENQL